MKLMTPSEAETKRRKAVEFLHRIGKDEDADRFEEMDAKVYAEHRGAQLLENPQRRFTATARRTKSKAELQAELDETNDYVSQLEAKLDDIAGIVSDDDEDEEDDDNGSDDDTDDDSEDDDNDPGEE